MAMTPEEYGQSLDRRIAAVLPQAAREVPALGRRVAEAGLEPDDLRSAATLDRLPIQTKDDLVDAQAAAPPFGGAVHPAARIRRVFQSPGPLYEPELGEADPWRWRPALEAAGFGSEDLVMVAFSYHLTPAGAMFEEACRAIGCRVLPAGIGAKDLQVRALADLGVTAYIGLPSYLKALLEEAETSGHDPSAWPLCKAFVTAEPLPPSLREWLQARVGLVLQGYGTAETGNLGYESPATDGLHVPSDALVQVCDLATGTAIVDDREGQVVVTVLSSHAPVVRLGTGDLSAWALGQAGADIPTPRLRGWLGRVGDAVKVRGMFLHPRQLVTAMDDIPQVDAYRFVIDRVAHRDKLRCEIAVSGTDKDGADGDLGAGTVIERVRQAVRSGLRFDVDVAVVDQIPPDVEVLDDRREWV